MSAEFLYKEYQLCFEQLRYYDTRHSDLLKYSFTLTSSIATAQFAVFQVLGSTSNSFYAQVFLSLIVFMATLLLFLGMLSNRLYFVMVARQINAIRKYMLLTEAENFKDNQLYTSTNFPVFKLSSIHTLQLIGTALISSFFAGSALFGIQMIIWSQAHIWISGVAVIVIGAAELILGFLYLNSTGKKTADEAVHKAY
ncbi:hypothetical protein MTYP_03009 [Methylophilaceae bacterium]|nr:hypothetical protein MTYP_03009 [Methylophilaceae bacterium]